MSSDTPLCNSLNSLMSDLKRDAAEPLVRIERPHPYGPVSVVFTDCGSPGFEYDIPCSGLADALRWITHVAPKTWVTKRHLELFALLMLGEFYDSAFSEAQPRTKAGQ